MILDGHNLMSRNQALTASAVSTDVIDLGVNRDIGPGGPILILSQVTEAFAGATSVQVDIQTSNASDFSTSKTLASSGAVVLANLKLGYQFGFGSVPVGAQRYLRANYTVVGTGTAGKITTGLILDRQSNV